MKIKNLHLLLVHLPFLQTGPVHLFASLEAKAVAAPSTCPAGLWCQMLEQLKLTKPVKLQTPNGSVASSGRSQLCKGSFVYSG